MSDGAEATGASSDVMLSVAVANSTRMRTREDTERIVDSKSHNVVNIAPVSDLKGVNDHKANVPSYWAYHRESPAATNDCAWSPMRARRQDTPLGIGSGNLEIVCPYYDEGD